MDHFPESYGASHSDIVDLQKRMTAVENDFKILYKYLSEGYNGNSK